ncbi:MAG: S1C family serine protease [Acidobacteria bacterium]|nr:S1C family serine protease [Acidobacteriota bacterium]
MNEVFASLSHEMATAIDTASPAVVQLHAHRRPFAGVVFGEDLILAPGHAFDDDQVVVRRADGHTLEGTVLGRGLAAGVAVIRVPSLGVPPLATAPEPRVGHLAIALGRTWSGATMATVTSVAVVGGPLRTGRASRLDRVIRVAQAPHGALTGGALIDGSGRALGIMTGAQIRGTTVVIPAELAWRLGQQVVAQGGTRQGFLGVGSTTVRIPERQRGGRTEQHGLLITSLVEGGPAEAAGLLLGDVITVFDGAPVREPDELVTLLRGDKVGRAVTVTVLRGGVAQEVPVTVGERPRR